MVPDMMRFSVIITLYNKAPYIRRAIRSAVLQSKKPTELIIVDDVSTDKSVEAATNALAELGDDMRGVSVSLISHEKNGGPGAARNTALDQVTGDYVFLLDADDEFKPGLFERAEHVFRSTGAGLLFMQFERDPGGRVLPVMEGLGDVLDRVEPDIYLVPSCVKAYGHDGWGMNGSSVAAKASFLKDHRYQTDLNCFEGLDFWYRVSRAMEKNGGQAVFLSGIQVTIHLVPDSVSRKTLDRGGEIYIPCQFEQFRATKDYDDQRLRRRIFIIWLRNAHLKMRGVFQRLLFYWRYKRIISTNLWLNFRYR